MAVEVICEVSGSKFMLTDHDIAFYEKMGVRLPRLSPDERRRRRMAWATFRALHRRECDRTGRSILSMYRAHAKHPVYHSEQWWSDSWDGCEYGRDFDFSRTFFGQFDDLFCQVPALHQSVILSDNCEYINMAGNCRNCYLSFYVDYCEDCFYLQDANRNRSCMDCLGLKDSELCYECVDCLKCYQLLFSQRCVGCYESAFLTDCRSCHHCIGCSNLVNKSYCIDNRSCSPEEFDKLQSAIGSSEGVENLRKRAAELSITHPKKCYFGHSSENSSGDTIHHVRNSIKCFNCHELENVKFGDYVFQLNNSMDVTIYGENSEWLYNCLKTGDQCSNNICCLCCWSGSSDNAYCHLVIGCRDCVGCSGLRHKANCILNKPYSRHEYEKLRVRIISHMCETGEWGQFFPIEMSPFAYNESIAQDYYPLTRDEALDRGYLWRDNNCEPSPKSNQTSGRSSDLKDAVLDRVFSCAATNKPFKVIKAELELYRRLGLPLPALCPEERHHRRFRLRNPTKLWPRTCGCCKTPIESTYSPDRPEKILCESCYQSAME